MHKRMGVGQLRWQCYCRHLQNSKSYPYSVVLAGKEMQKSMLSHVLKGEKWENSGSPLMDVIGSKKRTHPPLEQFVTWISTAQCPTVQTHTTHCMQEAKITISLWYRTGISFDSSPLTTRTRANVGWILIPKSQGSQYHVYCSALIIIIIIIIKKDW